MKLTNKQELILDSIVDKRLDQLLRENDYQVFFKAMLQKYGVKSPFQIKDPVKRKQFFNDVKAGWAKHPKNKKNM
jgi:hypothetical protein